MQVTGKLLKKFIVETGVSKAGKNWSRQSFLLETQEQYPKQIFMSAMNSGVIEQLENYHEGYIMTAHINIESREYNNSYFTNITAWRIEGDESNKKQNDSSDNMPW